MPIGFAARDDFVFSGLNGAIAAEHFIELAAENTMKMRFLHPAENNFTLATGVGIAAMLVNAACMRPACAPPRRLVYTGHK
jgi:hypothetical protein